MRRVHLGGERINVPEGLVGVCVNNGIKIGE